MFMFSFVQPRQQICLGLLLSVDAATWKSSPSEPSLRRTLQWTDVLNSTLGYDRKRKTELLLHCSKTKVERESALSSQSIECTL
jgi:hypothetical protein